MEFALTLVVLTLLQLCPAEIQNSIPEWYAANVIKEADYSPKPITEIFSTDHTFSPDNPIIVTESTNREDDNTSNNRHRQGFTQSTGFTQNLFPRLVSQQDGSTQRLLFPNLAGPYRNGGGRAEESTDYRPNAINFLEPLEKILQANTKLLPPKTTALSTYFTPSLSSTPQPTIRETQPEIPSSAFSQSSSPLSSSPLSTYADISTLSDFSSSDYSTVSPLPTFSDRLSSEHSVSKLLSTNSDISTSLQATTSTLTTVSDISSSIRSNPSPIEISSPQTTALPKSLPTTGSLIIPLRKLSTELPGFQKKDLRKMQTTRKTPINYLDNNIVKQKSVIERKRPRYFSRFVSRYNTSVNHINPQDSSSTKPFSEPNYTEPTYIVSKYTEPNYTGLKYTEATIFESNYTEPTYTESQYTEPTYTETKYSEPKYNEPTFPEIYKSPINEYSDAYNTYSTKRNENKQTTDYKLQIYSTQPQTLYKKDYEITTTEYPSILQDLLNQYQPLQYKAPEVITVYKPTDQKENNLPKQYVPRIYTDTQSTYIPMVYSNPTVNPFTSPPQLSTQFTIGPFREPYLRPAKLSTVKPIKTSRKPQTRTSKRPKASSHKPRPCNNNHKNPNTATTPVTKVVKQSNSKPVLTIRVKSPRLSIGDITVKPISTTKRPTTTKRKDNKRHNFDLCIEACKERKDPICASPAGVTPIDTNKLKGFPSLCHLACNNSFKKEQTYEKVADGRCGKLRTRIRTVEKDNLKREELNKAQYTIYRNDHEAVVKVSTQQR